MRVRYSVTDHSDSKKYKFLLLLPLLLSILFLTAQQQSAYSLKCSIPVETRFFTTDQLQNTYVVDADNQLLRFDANCEQQFQYNNNTLGELASVDVSNPLNIILFYPDFQTIVLLDRTLNFSGTVNLLDFDLLNVSCVASSVDNNIWLYDEAAFTLKKIDQKGTVIASSNDLSLELNRQPKPKQMIDRQNTIYMNDPEQGILIFNQYGQYQKTIPISDIASFQVLDNRIFYVKSGELFAFDLESSLTSPVNIPKESGPVLGIQIQKKRLYLHRSQTLAIYRL